MIKPDTNSRLYQLFTMLTGLILFWGVGAACYILRLVYPPLNPIFILIFILFGIDIVGIIWGVGRKIYTIGFAAVLAILLSRWLMIFLFRAFVNFNGMMDDSIYVALLNIIIGSIFGIMTYGRKAAWLFLTVCGVSAVPFGLLYRTLLSSNSIKIWNRDLLSFIGSSDPVWILLLASMGTGIGLSVGLYELHKAKNKEERRCYKDEKTKSDIF